MKHRKRQEKNSGFTDGRGVHFLTMGVEKWTPPSHSRGFAGKTLHSPWLTFYPFRVYSWFLLIAVERVCTSFPGPRLLKFGYP
jgi:hypothetical protein